MNSLAVIIIVLIQSSVLFAQSNTGTFTDYRDNRTYKWVKIGTQTWMAENLDYKTEKGSWSNTYVKLAYDFTDYGYFYNWKTAQNVAPDGWHLPSVNEWQELIDYVGGKNIAGEKLKSKNKWDDNGNGTDSYGFSALPGGTKGAVNWIYDKGYWWSSISESANHQDHLKNNAWGIQMSKKNNKVWIFYGDQEEYYNVRCIKD